ncbi:MAG: NAD(P)/FAD-dependent oxidoreductase [Ignavibacteria bacterium]|nr:NAD(P)/FAD-dependent oxidoreductase [Ignavibacteria bacterium]
MNVVVIGNGVAGVTFARQLRKSTDHQITVVSAESTHFYSRPALMYVYMGHMEKEHLKPYEDWFWAKNRIEILNDFAQRINLRKKHVVLANTAPLPYDVLVLATGSKPAFFNWPGQDLQGVQGFTTMQDLDRLEINTKSCRQAVIVGGGLIGIEVAEMLRSRGIEVSMLVREESYWNTVLPPDESTIVNAHIREHHVELQLNTELRQIVGDDSGRVRGVVTTDGKIIPCQLVVISTGVRPNIDLASSSGISVVRGISINNNFETSEQDIYAIGDCAQFPDGRVEQLWYTARHQGKHLAGNITGKVTPYEREPFYNSAKFFDIEYQTYGTVPADLAGIESATWKSENGRKFLRLTHQYNRVCGFNALGIRLRSEVCLKWIAEGASVEHVIEHLHQADFDQEFTAVVKNIRLHRSVA